MILGVSASYVEQKIIKEIMELTFELLAENEENALIKLVRSTPSPRVVQPS